jgi:hypothetical protein
MVGFKRAVRERDQFDNVYAEGRPGPGFRDCTTLLATKHTQTSAVELLALEDMIDVREKLWHLHQEEDENTYEETAPFPLDIARSLVHNVIMRVPEDLCAPRPTLPARRVK